MYKPLPTELAGRIADLDKCDDIYTYRVMQGGTRRGDYATPGLAAVAADRLDKSQTGEFATKATVVKLLEIDVMNENELHDRLVMARGVIADLLQLLPPAIPVVRNVQDYERLAASSR